MQLHNQVLLSRCLTRSGDQAWDFALPITLVMLFPENFALIAVLFLATKLGQFIFQPFIASLIDRWQRSTTAYFGTTLQWVSVVAAALCFGLLYPRVSAPEREFLGLTEWILMTGIAISSILASLAAGMMEIAIGNDWIPSLVPAEKLAHVNSRLKQIDLATEVLSPIAAGLLLALPESHSPLLGFYLVVLWNILSFIPEIFLLNRVFNLAPSLRQQPSVNSVRMQGIVRKTIQGWKEFYSHPTAGVMVAYAFLWLSALSPHGVLLTSFLKGGWQLSEWTLGLFRGVGALFGLLATILFPPVVRRWGVVRAALFFIFFQAVTLVAALPLFTNRTLNGLLFLALVLLSRIGLYGFSLAEMEIRQRSIAAGQRGSINGVASALTSFATLILFAAGTSVTHPSQFFWMVLLSVVAVCSGAFIYLRWFISHGRKGP